jgi:hypothetical protein
MFDNLCYFLFLVIYYQYNQSRIIPIKNSTWNDYVGLLACFRDLFGLLNSMVDYDFIIANKKVNFDMPKETFIKFIEDNQNSSSNPVRILDAKGMFDTIIIC